MTKPTVRPITLQWTQQGNSHESLNPLGRYYINKNGDFWVPILNTQPIPTLYQNKQDAQNAAALAQSLYNGPAFALRWEDVDDKKATAEVLGTTWEVVLSSGAIQGWYVMRDSQVALTAAPTLDAAKAICQTHLTVLWYSMTEQVPS